MFTLKHSLLLLIRLYQKTLSLDHGILGTLLGEKFCRFYPSCSEYSYQAINRFGITKGSLISLKRILRCHPWNKGGVDEVPEK